MTLKLAHDNVTQLDIRNLMDIPSMARGFADDLDAGHYGEVNRVLVVIDSADGVHTLGWGDSVSMFEALGILEAAKLASYETNFDD
jgi:hypothetical protein